MKNSKVEWIHHCSLAANAAATLFSIIILAYLKDFKYRQLLIVIIVFFQFLSIILDYFYHQGVVSDVFGSKEKKEALMRKANPELYKYSIQSAREELRYGLKILMSVAVICCLLFGFATHNILKAIVCLCVLSIAFIYADYIPHVKFYSERYDAKFLNSDCEKPNSIRGLARIYLPEYNKTKFKKQKKEYKDCLEFNHNKSNQIQDECIKNILLLGLDASVNYYLVFSIIITFFTAFSLIPGLIDDIVASFMINISIETSEIYPITLLILNFFLFTINIASSYEFWDENAKIKTLTELICEGTPEARLKKYNDNFANDYTIRARGIFNYCASFMNQNQSLNEIELKYKMLFTHRLDANRSRFRSTVVMLGLALFCLLIDLKVSWNYILVIGTIYIILSIAFRFLFLSRINKRRIIKFCKELEEAETSKRTGGKENA